MATKSFYSYLILCYLSFSSVVFAVNGELLNTQKLIEVGAEVTANVYPEANTVCIDDYTKTEYQKDGSYITLSDSCQKILTENGKRNCLMSSQAYDLAYGTSIFLFAEIIKPDGQTVKIDIAQNCKTMVDRSQMSANIYNPNNKVVTLNIPGLEVGDMIRIGTKRIISKARMPNTFCDYNVFEYGAPIIKATVEFVGPKDMPLVKKVVRGEIEGCVTSKFTEKDGKNIYKWTFTNVPQFFAEPKMPKMHTVVQRLLVSTIPNWETVSKWYDDLCAVPLTDTNAAMVAKVIELTKDCQSDQEKIEALFYFVSQKIRYMGITTEDTAPGYEPHNVSMTFDNKYGVCRDKAALLATMLRLAGFKGYPVLILSGPKMDKEVPIPFFNHAITAVEIKPNKYILMDPTDENTKELLPAYLNDKSYIVAKPKGDDLRVSAIIPAEENMLFIKTKALVDSQGTLHGKSTLNFNGINDNAYRGHFSTLKEDDLKKFFEKVIKRVVNGAKLEKYEVTPKNMLDVSTNLVVDLYYSAKDFPINNVELLTIEPLWVGSHIGIINFVLGDTALEMRKYPYVIDATCGVDEEFELDLSALVEDIKNLPKYKTIDNENMKWQQSLVFENSVLVGKSEKKLRTVELQTNQYAQLKTDLKNIEYEGRKLPIFLLEKPIEKGADSKESVYSDSDTVIELLDIQARIISPTEIEQIKTLRQYILTYAGKKDNAEIKINYNPIWDEVELLEAKVIGKDGTTKLVTEKEINIMDAGWASSAPRYPAAKTMVINLPGVDVGSLIEYKIKYKFKKRPFISFSAYGQSYDPIIKNRLTLEIPKKIKTKLAKNTAGDAGLIHSKVAGSNLYSWSMISTNVIQKENLAPPSWYFIPGFTASAGDWDDYAKLLLKTFKKAIYKQSATIAKAQEITATAKTRTEKIKIIRDFVAQNIRNAGPKFTSLPLSSISSADQVLADGYGNRADIGMLISAMLKGVGIKNEFVLSSYNPIISDLDSPAYLAPTRTAFDNLLVRVKDNGQWIYLNDTDQYAKLGTTSFYKRPTLNLASGDIFEIAIDQKLKNRNEVNFKIDLADDGSAIITKTVLYYGVNYGSFHKFYSEIKPEDKRRHLLNLVASISKSAVSIGDLEIDYDSYPGKLSYKVKVDRFAVVSDKNYHFNLPDSYDNVLSLNQDKRSLPIYYSGDTKSLNTYLVNRPPSYQKILLTPKNIDWKVPQAAGNINYNTVLPAPGGNLKIERKIDMNAVIIPAKVYPELLDINRKLSHPSNNLILLSK